MVVRTAPVREVIVDAASPTPLLLLGIGQTGEVAVVVVTPHQGHVAGNTQTALIDFEYFFIRNEHLRNGLHLIIIIAAQQLALVINHLLQSVQLLLLGLHTLHRAVVNAAHANGEELLAASHFLQALSPVALHLLAIGDIVVGAALLHVPFGHVVA